MQVLTFLHANICANLCETNLRTTVQYRPTAPYDRSLESPLHMNRRESPSVCNLIMSSCKESLLVCVIRRQRAVTVGDSLPLEIPASDEHVESRRFAVAGIRVVCVKTFAVLV